MKSYNSTVTNESLPTDVRGVGIRLKEADGVNWPPSLHIHATTVQVVEPDELGVCAQMRIDAESSQQVVGKPDHRDMGQG